jgi:hypothetical protein
MARLVHALTDLDAVLGRLAAQGNFYGRLKRQQQRVRRQPGPAV